MNTIVVFVKAPVPGKVKTRLCPPLSHHTAAGLYKAFVKDTLALAANVPMSSVLIAYDMDNSKPDLSWLNNGAAPPFFIQQGFDLGAKLIHAFNHAFSEGAKKVVAIGSDTPDLDPFLITQAFASLDNHDIVAGPAADGGYYLIGLNRPLPQLFEGISWSSPEVLEQTLFRVKQLSLNFKLLRRCSDIDTYQDLESLRQQIIPTGSNVARFTLQALTGWSSLPKSAQTNTLRKLYKRASFYYDFLDWPFERFRYSKLRPQLWNGLSGRILDMGAGTGRNTSFYPPNAEVITADLSFNMLTRARQRLKSLGLTSRVTVTDALNLAFKNREFDVCVSTFLFCVLPDEIQTQALTEIKRALHPGGRLYLLEYAYSKNPLRWLWMRLLAPLVEFLYGARFDRRTREHLTQAGFRLVEERFLYSDVLLLLVAEER